MAYFTLFIFVHNITVFSLFYDILNGIIRFKFITLSKYLGDLFFSCVFHGFRQVVSLGFVVEVFQSINVILIVIKYISKY